jgi:mono/diheme cytochrome c family protein
MKKFLKVLGIGLGVLVVLLVIGFGVVSTKASARLAQRFDAHKVTLPPPDSLEQAIDRGKHLVNARYACAICHGADFGGGVMIDDPAIGTLRGPNITKGGKGSKIANYKDADWDRIVRHGIKPDGTPAVMPSEDFFKVSDRELADMVAYIESLPPVDREVPAPSFGPIGKVLIVAGKFPISAEKLESHTTAHAAQPPETGDTKEFGAHLAAVCSGCHRANLAGGPMQFGPPDWPAAGNLTPHEAGLKGWSLEDFERAITQGISKDGRKLQPPMSDALPIAQAMTPVERRAMWTYLSSLQPHATNP